MKKIFLLFLSTLFTSSIFAQVKGKVVDYEQHTPLSDVTIRVAGAPNTMTDKNGEFTVACRDSVRITVSFIGYQPYQNTVGCNSDITIELMPATNNLNTVEITASSNPDKKTLYQPVSVARLNPLELKRGAGILLSDAVNINIPGVWMGSRTFSAGQQFNIRGYGNGINSTRGVSSNFDGQGYKVYLNGIPITDAEGITVLDDIDYSSIGGVDVLKGPAGTLYGQAIAGVVNLRSARPQPGKTSIGQEAMFGSYGLQRYTTSLQMGKERSSILLNYGHQQYDGFMVHTNSHKDFVNFIGEFSPNDRQSISTYVGYSNSYDARNGELTIQQYEAQDYSGNPNYIKNDAHSEVVSFRTGVAHTYRFNEQVSNTSSVFGTGAFTNSSSAAGWTDKNSVNYGFRSTFDTRFSIGKNLSLSGITGLEGQIGDAHSVGYAMVADSYNLEGYHIIGAQRSNVVPVSKTLSAFTEWTLGLPRDFALTAGIGYSTLNIVLNDRTYVSTNNNPGNPAGTHKPTRYENTFDGMVAPHIALNKVFNRRVSAYISYSTGYKAPVSSYFYIPTTGEVLTDLKPEFASQYEVGTKGTLFNDRLNYQVAGFFTHYKDKMTTIAVPNETNTATSYSYVVNGGEQDNKGLEVALNGVAYKSESFLKSINPFLNLAYSDFKYGDFKFQKLSSDKKSVSEVDYSNLVVAGVPPLTVNLGFDLFTKPGLYLNMTYSYRDKMYFTSDNLNQVGTYELLNAKIGYSRVLGKHIGLDLYAGANNLTGKQNYAMMFLNQLPDAYLPAPKETNYFGGVSLKYIF